MSRRTISGFAYDYLEPRRVLASAIPSATDQFVLELLNSARANPSGYAASLGIALNEGLPAGTISTAAKPPLAFNYYVVDAAQKHSDWMLATDTFSHTGSGGSNAETRMKSAGYVFGSPPVWRENIAFKATSAAIDPNVFAKQILENLFVDQGVSGRGHRVTMMDTKFMEVGIGSKVGEYKGFNAMMMTQDFAKNTGPFLTGVIYSDSVLANKFYTPGEGLGGIVITAIRDGGDQLYRTQTSAVGGYSLQLPKGRYSIMASGQGLGDSQFLPDVLMGETNRKLDFVKGIVRKGVEVAVYGNGRSIINKDNTPSAIDATFFGTTPLVGGTISKIFSIKNYGNNTLSLYGTTRVFTSSPEFTVTSLPPQTVGPGQTVTFTVRFDPNLTGTRTAVVQFSNTDRLEHPFTFTISGIGAEGIPPQGILAPGDDGLQEKLGDEFQFSMIGGLIAELPNRGLAGHQSVRENAADAAFRTLPGTELDADEESWFVIDSIVLELT
ncbi:MAG: choice-of-anchor D domain-containing protein [Pirellulaceae bacterium]